MNKGGTGPFTIRRRSSLPGDQAILPKSGVIRRGRNKYAKGGERGDTEAYVKYVRAFDSPFLE